MSSDRRTTRRRAARIVLIIGALFEFLLILALPLFAMDADAWRSFSSLLALLLLSIGSAIALRRWGREAVAALTIGSAYAAILIAWTTAVTYRELSTMPSSASSAQILGLALALGTFATVPVALAFAWPLRQVPAGGDWRTDLTPDSSAAPPNPSTAPRA
jgi:hypothetical protein